MNKLADIKVSIVGTIFTEITGAEENSRGITFKDSEGRVYEMYHEQDCCEDVAVAEVIGDITDLINSPIFSFEEVSEDNTDDEGYESGTWTFYKFQSEKGHVTLRWLGTSNGYYSERVDFKLVGADKTRPSTWRRVSTGSVY